MLGPQRRLPIALWIALHASLTLCGPGLHALWDAGRVGIGESPRGERAVGESGSGADADRPVLDDAHHAGDDCPLCSYFAQGQIQAPGRPMLTEGQRLFVAPPRRRSLAITADPLASSPRAPPLVAHARD